MSQRSTLFLAFIALVLVIGSESYYVVNETEKAVLKQFGKIIKSDIQPGIYGKLPFLQSVIRVDGRGVGAAGSSEGVGVQVRQGR